MLVTDSGTPFEKLRGPKIISLNLVVLETQFQGQNFLIDIKLNFDFFTVWFCVQSLRFELLFPVTDSDTPFEKLRGPIIISLNLVVLETQFQAENFLIGIKLDFGLLLPGHFPWFTSNLVCVVCCIW